eukprot:g877.t1
MTILVVQPTYSEKVTLRYFDIRGLAEPIRLALSYLKIEYEEVKYARCAPDCKNGLTDWTEAKKVGTESGLFAFSQVPSLTYGDTSLVQSEAILRFLGRKHGIAGETEIEHQRIDLFVGGLKDMRSKYGKMVYNKNALTDPQIMSDYLDVQRTWLPFFERLLVKSSGDGPYVAGSRVTFADFVAFDMIDSNMRIEADAFVDLPLLRGLASKVSQMDGVAKYLQSNKRRKRANGASATFDNPTNPPNYIPDWNAAKNDL